MAQCKESACQEGDTGLTPGLGRSPREGNDNLLQYSCLGNPMARGAWWVTVQGVIKELDMAWRLNNNSTCAYTHRHTHAHAHAHASLQVQRAQHTCP